MTLQSRILRSAALVGLALSAIAMMPATLGAQGTVAEGQSQPAHGKQAQGRQAQGRQARMIVLTDIGAEADDSESMVRLLLYSDTIDIQGLIASTSVWRPVPQPELIREAIGAYGKVHGNLLKHDAGYPSAETLNALVKQGIAEYGMKGVGSGKDSEGSDWILRKLEAGDDRPLWITVWGGVNTLAQALYTLRATRPPAEADRLVAKLRVYTISDQDDSGPWIRKNFPKLFYIVSPGGDYGAGTWTGINAFVAGVDNSTISNKWLAEHIQQGHGPLGAMYPDVAWGMEGDTPSWLALIPNGLNAPEHPEWGGWGGRYELYQPKVAVTDAKTFIGGVAIEQETRPIWTNATDSYTPPVKGEYGRAVVAGKETFRDFKATIWRWRDDFQNDFAARMEWCLKPSHEANHPPVVLLDQPAEITVRSGSRFRLGVHATDPDGDSLTYYWFQYAEAGSYQGVLAMGVEDMTWLDLVGPKVDKPETIHIIVKVTDKGTPALTRYQRMIVTVTP